MNKKLLNSLKKNNPSSAIMKSQQKNINEEVDWNLLDTFFNLFDAIAFVLRGWTR